jgi:hypothetical protein
VNKIKRLGARIIRKSEDLRFNNYPEALIFGSFHQGKEQRTHFRINNLKLTKINFIHKSYPLIHNHPQPWFWFFWSSKRTKIYLNLQKSSLNEATEPFGWNSMRIVSLIPIPNKLEAPLLLSFEPWLIAISK